MQIQLTPVLSSLNDSIVPVEVRNFSGVIPTMSANSGGSVTINVDNVTGKNMRMVSVNQINGLNLVPVWVETFSDANHTVTVRGWNGRGDAVSCSVNVYVLYY